MTRIIDADDLLQRVDEERKYLIARGQTGAEHILVHNFRDLIEEAPTVDAHTTGTWKIISSRPVSDPWWEERGDFMKVTCSCTSCGEIVGEFTEYPDFNFCPYCGAKILRGKEDNIDE